LKVPSSEPSFDKPNQDFNDDLGGEDFGDFEDDSSEKPFDDEPFDAGVETSEDEDPKKYIEQLSGKIGQSLRDYTEKQGHPDFELEKFAINSLLSATHTSEMDEEDRNDIINKVEEAGENDDSDNTELDNDSHNDLDGGDDFGDEDFDGETDEGLVREIDWDESQTPEEADPKLYPDGWKDMGGMFMGPNSIKKKLENLSKENKNRIFDQNNGNEEDMLLDELINKEFGGDPQEAPVETPVETPVEKPNTDDPTPVRRVDKPWKTPGIENDPDPKASK